VYNEDERNKLMLIFIKTVLISILSVFIMAHPIVKPVVQPVSTKSIVIIPKIQTVEPSKKSINPVVEKTPIVIQPSVENAPAVIVPTVEVNKPQQAEVQPQTDTPVQAKPLPSVCSNFPGQIIVPNGMVIDSSGNCIIPPQNINQPTNTQPTNMTPNPTPVSTPTDNVGGGSPEIQTTPIYISDSDHAPTRTTLEAGDEQILLAAITLSRKDDQPCSVNSITFTDTGYNSYSDLQNFRLVDDKGNSYGHIIPSESSYGTVSFNLRDDGSLNIPGYADVTLELKADVSSDAISGDTHGFSITDPKNITTEFSTTGTTTAVIMTVK
jgi:hypothetical protein